MKLKKVANKRGEKGKKFNETEKLEATSQLIE